ncbi:hypothetical protein GQ457_14G015890 [Hibiscus cannabinus]
MQNELATDVILQSLSDNFKQFILNFNMNEIDKTLPQLLGMTKSKGNGESKRKEKDALKSEGEISKEGKCFHGDKPGHLKKETAQFILKKSRRLKQSEYQILYLCY